MSTSHTVQAGDSIASIAAQAGLTVESIWLHPTNSELKQLRKNSNILYPGDMIEIPDIESQTESCATGARHTFRCKSSTMQIRVKLVDEQYEPRSNLVGRTECDGLLEDAATDTNGMIELRVPAQSSVLKLLFAGETLTLDIGHLDPIDCPEGIQARLSNLGYLCGLVDGILGPLSKTALIEFQRDNNLAETGKCDADTKALLSSRFGC